jgi:hypothetical protein
VSTVARVVEAGVAQEPARCAEVLKRLAGGDTDDELFHLVEVIAIDQAKVLQLQLLARRRGPRGRFAVAAQTPQPTLLCRGAAGIVVVVGLHRLAQVAHVVFALH